jgi:hypothetical protein
MRVSKTACQFHHASVSVHTETSESTWLILLKLRMVQNYVYEDLPSHCDIDLVLFILTTTRFKIIPENLRSCNSLKLWTEMEEILNADI